MKLGVISFIIVLCICISIVIFGKNGYLDYYRLQQTGQRILEKNNELLKKNEALKSKIERFKKDPQFAKMVIRHYMGLTEKDEILFFPSEK